MNRWLAISLLVVAVLAGWFLFTSTSIATLFVSTNSPVLFTYGGLSITLAWLFWGTLIIVGWLAAVVAGFAIDPVLGYLIFRLGLSLIFTLLRVESSGSSSSSSSNSGSGSGRSGRGG